MRSFTAISSSINPTVHCFTVVLRSVQQLLPVLILGQLVMFKSVFFQVFSLQIEQKFPLAIQTVRMNDSWISVRSAVHDRSASIFLFPRFPVSNEPAGFHGKL